MTKEIDYDFDPDDLVYHPEDSSEERGRRIDRALAHPGYTRFFHDGVSGLMPAVEAKDISRRTYQGIKGNQREESL